MGNKVVIAGGSGFLGRSLAERFAAEGWEVVVLSRSAAPVRGPIRTELWDGKNAGDWSGELEGAAAVINLAGRSVACLHTPENRRQILASRVDSVLAIDRALQRCGNPPPAWVQAGSLAIYGSPGDRVCDESAPHADDFSAEVCKAWEDALFSASPASGVRRAVLRIGLVFGRGGGALGPLAGLARRFLGGTVGDGRQFISWLHEEDFYEMCRWIIDHPSSRGAYNATGPRPVTNAEFMRALRRALHRPWCPPAPRWAVALIARRVMKVEPHLALDGRRCIPGRLLSEGFSFARPDLAEALESILA